MSDPVGSEVRRVRTDAGLIVVLERFGHPSEQPPVLFVHGGGQTRHSWSGTAGQLAARRCEAMDLRGNGDSDWAADAIAAYRPNRPRPSNLDGLRKNLRRGEETRPNLTKVGLMDEKLRDRLVAIGAIPIS